MTRHALARLLACVLLLSAVVPAGTATATTSGKIDPALLERMAADRSALLPVVVEMTHASAPFGSAPNVARAQRGLELLRRFDPTSRAAGITLPGDAVTRAIAAIPLIDSAAGFANAPAIEMLSDEPDVAYVHYDATVGPRSHDEGIQYPPGQLAAAYPRVVRADKAWLQGYRGSGVAVAVLDSGVAPHEDLGHRIVASVDFAGGRTSADPGGHGTHVAGIVAGSGKASAGQYVGVAPSARIVDVRVLNENGNGRVSSVARGIEWVLAHRATYGIRVINLSFGAPARRSYRQDPLSAAVEIAWRRGVVVVAAAGNEGPAGGAVGTPGIDPYVITVGSTDDRGTLSASDDVLASYSSWGTPHGAPGTSKPDVVVPGRRIVSLRVPGSSLDLMYPDRIVFASNGSTYFRLSGTSMGTGVVSGLVALALQHRPALTPDQVKWLFMATVQPYGESSGAPLADPTADGAGLVDVEAVIASKVVRSANSGLRPSDPFARSLYPVLYGTRAHWRDGRRFEWESVAWDSVAWDGLAWDSVAWDSVAWDSVAWDSVAWDSVAWDALDLD